MQNWLENTKSKRKWQKPFEHRKRQPIFWEICKIQRKLTKFSVISDIFFCFEVDSRVSEHADSESVVKKLVTHWFRAPPILSEMPFGTLFLGWLWRSTRRSRRGPMETKIVSAQNSIPQEQFPTPIVKINPRVWSWEVFNRKTFLNFNEPLWRHRWLIGDKVKCIRANFWRSFRWAKKKKG